MWSAGQVSADLPRRVSSWTPAAYGQTRGSDEEVEVLLAVPIQLRTPTQWARLRELIGASSQSRRRKRKKRRKRRTPRTSSRSLRGCAHRRQRQWHVSGFPGDVSPRAVFPSYGGRPRCLASWWPPAAGGAAGGSANNRFLSWLQRIVEQNVYVPVPRGGCARSSRFFPGQASTTSIQTEHLRQENLRLLHLRAKHVEGEVASQRHSTHLHF